MCYVTCFHSTEQNACTQSPRICGRPRRANVYIVQFDFSEFWPKKKKQRNKKKNKSTDPEVILEHRKHSVTGGDKDTWAVSNEELGVHKQLHVTPWTHTHSKNLASN